jgi:hypothetical protein
MNVKVIFFPPKLHQLVASCGVIHLLTAKYREVLLQKAVTAIENKTELKLNILQAVHVVVAARILLTSATMRNYFRKAVFPTEEDSYNEVVGVEDWRNPN